VVGKLDIRRSAGTQCRRRRFVHGADDVIYILSAISLTHPCIPGHIVSTDAVLLLTLSGALPLVSERDWREHYPSFS
jgi:hypothetical protein